MAGQTYDSVPVRVERFDDEGVYKVGIVLDNAFVTIAGIKTGTVDELVERERVKAEAKAQADAEQVQRAERERQQQSQSQSQSDTEG